MAVHPSAMPRAAGPAVSNFTAASRKPARLIAFDDMGEILPAAG